MIAVGRVGFVIGGHRARNDALRDFVGRVDLTRNSPLQAGQPSVPVNSLTS
jgi:hypothetical protein